MDSFEKGGNHAKKLAEVQVKYDHERLLNINNQLKIGKTNQQVKEVSLAPCQAPTDMSDRSKEDYHDENARLKKRVKELEKALAFSRLETEARDLMIRRCRRSSV